MAKIPAKHKRQLKSVYKAARISGDAPKPTREWSVKPGDLVEVDGEHALVLKQSQGSYLLLTSDKTFWCKGSMKIKQIQNASPARAKEAT